MQDWAALLREFHAARGDNEGQVTDRVLFLRARLMNEELAELLIAMDNSFVANNPEKILDSLCDLLYVVVGTADQLGFGPVLDAAFREVHRSNMTKDHKAIAMGRKYGVNGKGASYEPPNLKQFLKF